MNKSIILNDIEQMIKTKYIDPLAKIKFSKLNDHFNNKKVLGVYFVFNEKNELIYVGQSGANKNSDSSWGLKNRINQH
ncbi:GIY-YIG nuclease family protein [Candidatus Enterococcus ikei]|uniref:GIY-YIG nuclease family protein n=1 Tax=Candidatus Enterococcus ikei TaxID=2815326 RepID=A0ABS3GWE8_9ENTE|nr:GIY-YIG nuclease family protein [Enterococcus sp. DIV0869a]MBO0439608.1 GIY-YIG nuclease family protein [Enterococcus sp. DIV0869a]